MTEELELARARAAARQRQAIPAGGGPGGFVPIPEPIRPPRDPVGDIRQSLLQGVTVEFGDEITAALGAALDSDLTFEQALALQQGQIENLPTRMRVAGGIVGGAMIPGAIGLRAPTGLAQAARQGAALGAVAGAGATEGGLPERAMGAVTGAAIGAPLAAGGQAAVQGGTRAITAARQGLPGPQQRAVRRAAEELSAAGTTPQRVAAQQQRLGPEAVLADVLELQRLAQQTAVKTAAGQRIAQRALESRQAGSGARVDQALDIALGGQNLRTVRTGILNARREAAEGLYDAALNRGPLNRTDALEALIGSVDDPRSGSSLVRGTMGSIRRSNPRFRNASDTDPDLLHATRVALSERSRGQGAQKRNINDVVQQLTDAMEDAGAEGYGAAVDQYRSDSLTLEAFDRGRRALAELPEDIEAFLRNAPTGERTAFVAGLGREAQRKLATGETGSAVGNVRGLLRGEKAQVLRESLGPEAYDAFRTRLLRELEFSRTATRVLGGSPTQPRQQAAAEQFRRMGRAARAVQSMRQGAGIPGGIAELLSAAETGPRIANERALAQLLFATNRQGLDPSRFQAQNPLQALAAQQRLIQRTAPFRSAVPGAAAAGAGQITQPLLGQF